MIPFGLHPQSSEIESQMRPKILSQAMAMEMESSVNGQMKAAMCNKEQKLEIEKEWELSSKLEEKSDLEVQIQSGKIALASE
jgi:hypothetical protein